jgi:hypothetical protein
MSKNDDQKDNDDQEQILNYKPLDFKDIDILTYTLKINSKDRNYIREPNPFNFEIIFNQIQTDNNPKAIITSKFEKIKRITLSQVSIPRYIPRDYMGEPVTGITPVYNTANSISLSYYPGININNTVIYVLDSSNNEIKIEVLELVDLNNKKLYLVALQYNNPFYLSKYISVKAELFSYINIDNNIYPITNIIGNIISLGNTTLFPLPVNTNSRLIIGDFYKNSIMVDNDGSRIGINTTSIQIVKANILNFQYLFSGQYLEYQVNAGSTNIISERKLFKISTIIYNLTDSNLPSSIDNTTVIINGKWVDGLPTLYNITPIYYDNSNTIRLNQFNFGVRDLFDERVFYINLSPFTPSKDVSTDPTINKSFGVLYPSTPNSTKDFLYLRGEAAETYTNVNLQNTFNKIRFSLMDSNNQLIGSIYNKYQNLYNPTNNVPLTSYLPFLPDVNIILKFEEVDKKFTNLG